MHACGKKLHQQQIHEKMHGNLTHEKKKRTTTKSNSKDNMNTNVSKI